MARVSGYLVKVAFQDGEIVKKDALLYQIDPRPFQAVLDQALASVECLRARKETVRHPSRSLSQVGRKRVPAANRISTNIIAKQAENIGVAQDGGGPGGAGPIESRFHPHHGPRSPAK